MTATLTVEQARRILADAARLRERALTLRQPWPDLVMAGMFEPKTVVDPATGKARRVEHPVDPPPSRRDPDLGRLLRDDAIVAVAAHTRADWIALARQAVRELCAAGRPFTSDDVWDTIDRRAGGRADPPEPRALGAVMRWADRQGLAVPTDRTTPSQRPDCHRRPIRIWQPTR